MQKPSFSELGLSAEILKAVAALGYEEASPIQSAAIPVMLEGKDVVGQSQTGSGKTAAFSIPAIEKVEVSDRSVQVLILCPTRELATQVADDVHKLSAFKRGLSAVPIYGGASYERQFSELKKGVQIVIGTPGRLIDHLDRGTLKLDRLKMVILDEADRMLDMGFRDDIQKILDATPENRQTVFFSATVSPSIRQLIKRYSQNPVTLQIQQKEVTVPTVEQYFYEVRPRLKVEALIRLLDFHNFKSGIIFCNTQRMVEELADALQAQGMGSDRLHGGISQAQRTRVMNKFKKADFQFLVATDVAGRGIDVENLEVVVNYDLPNDPEDYVHRIGRTGRAGRTGMAATFVFGREIYKLQYLERFTRSKIRLAQLPSPHQVEEKKTDLLRHKVRMVLEQGTFRPQNAFIERLMDQGFNSTDVASALVHLLMGGEEAPEPAKEKTKKGFGTATGVAAKVQDSPERTKPKAKREPRREEPKAASVPEVAPKAPREEPKEASVPEVAPQASREEPKEAPVREVAPKAPKAQERETMEKAPPGETPKGMKKAARGMVWVKINTGRNDGVTPRDLVDLMTGETDLPPKAIGMIEFVEDDSFVQVEENHLNQIMTTVQDMAIEDRPLTIHVVEKGPVREFQGDGRGKPKGKRLGGGGRPSKPGKNKRF